MTTSKRTRTMVRCHSKGTRWRTVTSSSGRRSTTTRRNQRLVCLTRGFRHMTGSATTSRWSKTVTGRTARPRWDTWVLRRRMDTVRRTVTSPQHRRCILHVSCRLRRRRQVGCRAVRLWNRRSRCRTICTLSSTWCSTACRTSSTSCTRWTTCSTRRKCRRCTSSQCTRSSPLPSSLHLTLMPRCQVHYTPG